MYTHNIPDFPGKSNHPCRVLTAKHGTITLPSESEFPVLNERGRITELARLGTVRVGERVLITIDGDDVVGQVLADESP